ncbi:MAG TPA: sigma 54-interacting transcriptional regulator [Polyangiaceae bacterium]
METLGSTLSAERLAPDGGGPRFALSVALFADRPLDAGARHPLDADEVLIGRGAERASTRARSGRKTVLTLRFDDPRMSTTHARLLQRGDGWTLVDQGSKNGSRRNGAAVEQAALADGDVLELGSTFFVVRSLPDASLAAAERTTSAPLGIPTLHLTLGAMLDRLAKVAPSLIAVVLTGESGTGKEVLARAIHRASGRAGRFQAINCGALPATLVEAELFGCKRGAFSGAIADRDGIVRSADGGTLLLDEIGDLPLPSQAALLRVLQEHEVMPVGDTRAIPVDVRFLAATHRDLRALVAAGTFREDLLARLSGFHLQLPPLRERREDLGLLVGELLRRLAPQRAGDVSLTRRAARALFAHDWPQNVRELEKCLEAALVFAGDSPIELEHLPPALAGASPADGRSRDTAPPQHGSPERLASPEDEARRAELVRLLESHRGNLSAVARELGKARFQVQRWMKRYELRPEDYR